jgi:hypothetical protein
MNVAIFHQLRELTEAFNRIGLKPVICGGLGIYLLFRDRSQAVRATQDIDLIITRSQASDRATREAIAQAIVDELQYVAREDGRCFRFTKEPTQQQLDILTPPMEVVATEGGRVKLIRTKLHGRLTPEACFVEEDLRTVDLALLMPGPLQAGNLLVSVPSPANMLILKLFAFDDRDSDSRRDEERARAHAYDIYLITTLAQLSDFTEGRDFLRRHEGSDVVRKAREIVATRFLTLEHPGWKYVLTSAAFYPGRSIDDRREQLDLARRRLLRWFEEQKST